MLREFLPVCGMPADELEKVGHSLPDLIAEVFYYCSATRRQTVTVSFHAGWIHRDYYSLLPIGFEEVESDSQGEPVATEEHLELMHKIHDAIGSMIDELSTHEEDRQSA